MRRFEKRDEREHLLRSSTSIPYGFGVQGFPPSRCYKTNIGGRDYSSNPVKKSANPLGYSFTAGTLPVGVVHTADWLSAAPHSAFFYKCHLWAELWCLCYFCLGQYPTAERRNCYGYEWLFRVRRKFNPSR